MKRIADAAVTVLICIGLVCVAMFFTVLFGGMR